MGSMGPQGKKGNLNMNQGYNLQHTKTTLVKKDSGSVFWTKTKGVFRFPQGSQKHELYCLGRVLKPAYKAVMYSFLLTPRVVDQPRHVDQILLF